MFTISEGVRNQRNATRIFVQVVVRMRRTPKDSESLTLRNRSAAVRAPGSVIMTLPAVDTKGAPGVVNRAGRAITAVKIGINSIIRFRKNPRGTLDSKLKDKIRTNRTPSIHRLRARPTITIKRTNVATLTRGSRPWSNPGARHRSSARMTDSSARVKLEIFLARKPPPLTSCVPIESAFVLWANSYG
jgi:hypothetical protein